MKHFIFLFTLFSSELFFCLSAIIGFDYSGSDSSSSYALFCVAVFILSLFTFLINIRKIPLTNKEFLCLFFLGVYFFSALVSGYLLETTGLSFTAFGIPAALIGIYYARYKNFSNIVKWLDPLMIVLIASMPFLLLGMFTSFDEKSSHYSQSLSYYAAFGFLLDILLINYGDSYSRFKFTKHVIYKYVSYFFLPFFVVVILVSGGKGGLVTLCLGSFIFWLKSKNKKKLLIKLIVVIALVALALVILLYYYEPEHIDAILLNFDRINMMLSFDDSTKATSGRNVVFLRTLQLFADSPIWGYGLFSYKTSFEKLVEQPYPHNLFLEFLIQGGLILFFFMTFMLVRLGIKYLRILKQDKSTLMFFPMVIYGFTKLLFSGSYLESSIFWFFLFFLINYKVDNNQTSYKTKLLI